MNKLLSEIKSRNIRKWLAIYVSTAITTFGVTHLLSNRYDWPDFIFDTIFISLLFGLITIFLIAWFHGEKGKQKIKMREIVLHSSVVLFLAAYLFFYVDYVPGKRGIRDKKVVAVLPFSNFNDTDENGFFADGMTEDILTQLSKISDLKIISRTSVMKYKDSKMNIIDIADELGAGSILEGSVRTSDKKIRIVSQLIDATEDTHIWSETYDRELKDIFTIQSEIAEKIAASLQVNLLPIEKELMETKNTENIDAYTYYLKGRHFYYNYNEEDNEKSIDLYKKALEIDSNYALAMAGLADSYNQKVGRFWYPEELYDTALALGKKAIRINPNLPEAYKAIGFTYSNLGEMELALSNYERAIKLNPNFDSAILNYGQLKWISGNYDEALYWIGRANVIAPDNLLGIISRSYIYKFLECDSLAIKWGKKAAALEPENPHPLMNLGDVFLYAGKFKEANKYFKQAVKMDEKLILGWFLGSRIEAVLGNHKLSKEYMDKYMEISGAEPEYFYAYSLLQLNKNDEAKKLLEKEKAEYIEYLKKHSTAASTMDYVALAEIYSILNEKEKAITTWKEAIVKGWTDTRRNTLYPYFENIRSEPEYQQLLNVMHAKIDSMKTIIREKYPEYEICD